MSAGDFCDVFEAEGQRWILLPWSAEAMDALAAVGAAREDLEPEDVE